MQRPNFLLLTIDTLRADVLGCYGYPRSLTPNLDRLAATGLRFTQAITGGSWTQAAFPVLLTSSSAGLYGGCLGRLAPARPSPVEALAADGYATGGFSTNPHLSKATGYDRGFYYFDDLVPNEADPLLSRVKGGQRLLRHPLTHRLSALLGKRLRPAQVYNSAEEVTDSACRWLEQVESPFFGWIHYMDVHWPYYLEKRLEHPGDIAQAWRDRTIMHERANFTGKKRITPGQREHFVELYQKALRYLDDQIGRLLEHVKALGHDSNTVIIAVSDHGEEFMDHGRWGHWESNLYDEIVKVPLIIRMPRQAEGEVIERQVRLLDLMPTILDLGDCPQPPGVEGTSLTPLWLSIGSPYEAAESISEMRRPPWHRIAVRTESFKYIWDNKRPDQPELYDLRHDPGETENVLEEHREVADRLQACVDVHLQRARETEFAGEGMELELDKETVERLRALGYIE